MVLCMNIVDVWNAAYRILCLELQGPFWIEERNVSEAMSTLLIEDSFSRLDVLECLYIMNKSLFFSHPNPHI